MSIDQKRDHLSAVHQPDFKQRTQSFISFLERLSSYYLNQSTSANKSSSAVSSSEQESGRNNAHSLMLAQSLFRDVLSKTVSTRSVQVAVLGPTQVGKSTLVNLILGGNFAMDSPLAGYTRHPQGFIGLSSENIAWLRDYFPGWKTVQQSELVDAQLRAISVSCIQDKQTQSEVQNQIDWDTWDSADFDSLSSSEYRQGVYEIIGFSDILFFVLSKEKYSDRSVWEMLKISNSLNRQMIICLNKVTPDSLDIIKKSIYQRCTEIGIDGTQLHFISIPYFSETSSLSERDWKAQQTQHLQTFIKSVIEKISRSNRKQDNLKFISNHWQAWIQPAIAENEARRSWSNLIDEQIQSAAQIYKQEYLENSDRYESFQLALLKLLQLLELPGLASTLPKTRQFLTWPARKLFQKGILWSKRIGVGSHAESNASREDVILHDIVEHVYSNVRFSIIEKEDLNSTGSIFWKEIGKALNHSKKTTVDKFNSRLELHHQDFEQEIDAAADRLFNLLQDRPVLLNSLRAARATSDILGVVLAVKSGGINMHDLVFAPAMLSLTSSLTEGALGVYMIQEANKLKEAQFEFVSEKLLKGFIGSGFNQLASDLTSQSLFQTSENQLDEFESLIRELELHG